MTSGTNGQTGTASIAEVITYDDLGIVNIKTLKRDALTATTYTYTGNKLMSLSGGLKEAVPTMLTVMQKQTAWVRRSYNYLNLPQTAKRAGVDVAFLYDAMGTKLQKLSKIGTAPNLITTTRYYFSGIEYNNGAIDIIDNSEGYAQRNGTNYVYHYNLTDHLGNVRATLKRGSNSTAVDVAQRDNYYPFGKRKVLAGGNNNYLYNGKEIQGELGDQYDYGARFYDAEIGRWNVVDPLAEKYKSASPCNYAINNPILFIDPDGRDFIIYYGDNQSFVFNGENQKEAPKDQFVQNFLAMYNYNIENGGADNTLGLATNSKYQVDVREQTDDNRPSGFSKSKNDINWNPFQGGETHTGKIISAATIFEHEAGHAKSYNDDPEKYLDRVKTSSSKYKNKEEERVVTTIEQKVARANGEIKGNEQTRTFYNNSLDLVRTLSTTSTTKTNTFYSPNLLNKIASGYNITGPFRTSKEFSIHKLINK